GGFAFCGFAAAVVAGGGGDVGVAGETLHRGDIGPGVEQVAYHGAAEVMWRERGDPSLSGALAHGFAHGMVAHMPEGDGSTLVYRAKEGTGGATTRPQPGIDV